MFCEHDGTRLKKNRIDHYDRTTGKPVIDEHRFQCSKCRRTVIDHEHICSCGKQCLHGGWLHTPKCTICGESLGHYD